MAHKIRIASRKSPLAVAQAEIVAAQLKAKGYAPVLCLMSTPADENLQAQLVDLGANKGLFTSTLEQALLAGEADIAVHSLKDLPTILPDAFHLAAILEREDVRDALVGISDLSELGEDAVVGTGSPRRQSLLLAHQQSLKILPIRGNVQTRIKRLERDCDAVALAMAGLRRVDYQGAMMPLDPEVFTPAAGQGALAVECLRDGPWVEALSFLNDKHARATASLEREIIHALGAQCHAPVGAYATLEGDVFTLRVFVGAMDGQVCCRFKGTHSDSSLLLKDALAHLEAEGVWDILKAS